MFEETWNLDSILISVNKCSLSNKIQWSKFDLDTSVIVHAIINKYNLPNCNYCTFPTHKKYFVKKKKKSWAVIASCFFFVSWKESNKMQFKRLVKVLHFMYFEFLRPMACNSFTVCYRKCRDSFAAPLFSDVLFLLERNQTFITPPFFQYFLIVYI